MRFWIGVENFAKIESARVCINNYTLFVGPNNSGKTFLMQLIQGLSDKITGLLDEDVMDIVLAEKIEGYSKYLINKDNIVQFTECINKKLHLKKEQIIEDIFKKTIPIEKLYIDVELENNSFYKIDITDNKCLENEKIRKLFGQQLFSHGSVTCSHHLRSGGFPLKNTNVFSINGLTPSARRFSRMMFHLYLGYFTHRRKLGFRIFGFSVQPSISSCQCTNHYT